MMWSPARSVQLLAAVVLLGCGGGQAAPGAGGSSGGAAAGASGTTGSAGQGGPGGSDGGAAGSGTAGSGGSDAVDAASDAPPATYAATCAAYRAANPTAITDGNYVLYQDGRPERRFEAFCADMATTPLTYLTLQQRGTSMNVSGYDATTVGGTTVVTRWMRVRFDAVGLSILPADFRFSTSTGSVPHESTTQVPYGVARDCAVTGTALGIANVDLRGLPFAAIPNWSLGGFKPLGSTMPSGFNQVVSITGGGECGWNAPGGDRLGGTPIPVRWCSGPSTEICDGVDNDCDGIVDNGC